MQRSKSEYKPLYSGWLLLLGPWHQNGKEQTEEQMASECLVFYKYVIIYKNEDRFTKQRMALEAYEFFIQPLFQKGGRIETLAILELQITKEVEDLGILKFCGC